LLKTKKAVIIKSLGPVTRQLRWRTEASGWAASAACSHHPTARVGHSRGSSAIRTSYVGRRQHVTRTHVDEVVEKDGPAFKHGRASTAGTISIVTWVFMANHVEKTTDKRTTWRPWKFTSVERMSRLCQPKQQMYRDKTEGGRGWSFKDHGNSTRAPIARGANVLSVCTATC
jgi:hypothetical protein